MTAQSTAALVAALAVLTGVPARAKAAGCLGPEVGETISARIRAGALPVPAGRVIDGVSIDGAEIRFRLAGEGVPVQVVMGPPAAGGATRWFSWRTEPPEGVDDAAAGRLAAAVDTAFGRSPWSPCGDARSGGGDGRSNVLVLPAWLALALAAVQVLALGWAGVMAVRRLAPREGEV